MSNEPIPAPKEAPKADGKTCRVEVLTQGFRYKKLTCSKGHVIEKMPLAEYELRKNDGDLLLLNLNP